MTRVVIVLGAAGLVGSASAEYFRNSPDTYEVVGIDRVGSDVNIDLRSGLDIAQVINEFSNSNTITHLTIVNCAGQTVFTETEQRTLDEIVDVSASQLGISILALNQLVGYCLETGIPGNAVLMSSIFASNAPRFEIYASLERRSSEIYGATKAGVEQLTRYYAKRYGQDRIRFNCVSPGGILDPKIHSDSFQNAYSSATALGRMTKVEEVVEVIAFLASEKSSGVTGATIRVDCGYAL